MNNGSNISEKEEQYEDIEQELIPVLFPCHLHCHLFHIIDRFINCSYIIFSLFNDLSLIVQLTICFDYYFMSLNRRAFDPLYLSLRFVYIVNTKKESITIILFQLDVSVVLLRIL